MSGNSQARWQEGSQLSTGNSRRATETLLCDMDLVGCCWITAIALSNTRRNQGPNDGARKPFLLLPKSSYDLAH
jgi:hypothetical protein